MTITYSLDVSSSTFLGFHRLLFRWKGSIWKSILPELICWLFTYYALSISYRKLMKKEQQMLFEDICIHKLLRLNPRTDEQLQWVHQLYSSDLKSSPPYFDLDFWQPPSLHSGALVDLTVSQSDSLAFFDELKRRNFDYLLIADDLEELIEKQSQKSGEDSFWDDDGGHLVGEGPRGKEPPYRYDRYNPLTRIEEQLFRLRESNPRIVTLYEIGRTHENRSIVLAKVSAREHFPDERFPSIFAATAMLFLARLINGYNARDPNIRYLVESIDWYITPVLNPDGYEYSHTKNRMWRKNRRPAFCKQQYFNRICCSGVDLNRNFDWFWSTTGSSADPCHETYHGPSAFSEPEARAVRDFLEEHLVKAFFTLHSYSQLWLIPYGHKRRNYPEDYTKIQVISQKE
uniref:Bestrophin homolog n=1 Tax=Globodera pallida TaxID=36090 RepID=A0A183C605_GLOPA